MTSSVYFIVVVVNILKKIYKHGVECQPAIRTTIYYFIPNKKYKYFSSSYLEIMLIIPLFSFSVKQIRSDVVQKSSNFAPKIFFLQKCSLCNFYRSIIHIRPLMVVRIYKVMQSIFTLVFITFTSFDSFIFQTPLMIFREQTL